MKNRYTVPRMWALLKKEADVDGRRAAVAQHNAENLFVKRGLAMAACRFVMSVDAKPAIVSIHHDGTVHVTSAGHVSFFLCAFFGAFLAFLFSFKGSFASCRCSISLGGREELSGCFEKTKAHPRKNHRKKPEIPEKLTSK